MPKCKNCGSEMIQALGNPLSQRDSALFYICPNVKCDKAPNGKPMICCEPKPKPEPKLKE